VWPESYRVGDAIFTLYDVMRFAAATAAIAVAVTLNRRQHIPARWTIGIALCCVPLSILASWLLDALEYAPSVGRVGVELARNGSSIYGGLVASLAAVWLLTTLLGIPVLRFLDAGGPAIAVGEAITRIGCFCAGCCYGVAWNGPWAVVFPGGSFALGDQQRRGLLEQSASHSLAVHPVQLYGTAIMLLVAIALWRRFRQPHAEGEIFFLTLTAYGAYRLAIAPLRVEALASMKVFSLLFVAAGAAGLLWCRSRRLATAESATVGVA
jgi:phosphatidylglycerol:prolipoprotein diacylglycerol transferase